MSTPWPDSRSPRTASDEHLLAEARAGSLEARGRLLMGFRFYLLRLAHDALDADLQAKGSALDLMQETFQEAHQDFDSFRGQSTEEVRAWLRRILRHNLANFFRHYRATGKRQIAAEIPLDLDDSECDLHHLLVADLTTPSGKVMRAEQEEALHGAVDRLPPMLRDVIRWRYQENRSFADIGRLIGASEGAARMRYWRALERLREELEPQV